MTPEHKALVAAEASFEKIRLILVNHLDEPERSAFWEAVSARDKIRESLSASPAAQVAEAGVEDHPRDTNSVVYHNPPSVIDNATPANPSRGVSKLLERSADHVKMAKAIGNFGIASRLVAELSEALTAAIGAGSRLNMPVGDGQKYRLLEAGEIIASDDEFIGDDGITWERVKGWPVGYTYTHIFKSCRRPLAAARAGEDGR